MVSVWTLKRETIQQLLLNVNVFWVLPSFMTENWTSLGTKRHLRTFYRRLISLEHQHYITLRLCWQITGSAASRDSRRTCRSSIKPHDCSLIASAGRRRVCSVTYDLLPPPSLFSARIDVLYEAHYYRTKLLKQVQPVWAPTRKNQRREN